MFPVKPPFFLRLYSHPQSLRLALGELTTDEVNKIVAVATGIFGP
jgi:hypothetical protein